MLTLCSSSFSRSSAPGTITLSIKGRGSVRAPPLASEEASSPAPPPPPLPPPSAPVRAPSRGLLERLGGPNPASADDGGDRSGGEGWGQRKRKSGAGGWPGADRDDRGGGGGGGGRFGDGGERARQRRF